MDNVMEPLKEPIVTDLALNIYEIIEERIIWPVNHPLDVLNNIFWELVKEPEFFEEDET